MYLLSNKEKTKKPIYKRWWFIALALIVLVSIASGGNEEVSEEASSGSEENVVAEEDTTKEADQAEEVEEVSVTIESQIESSIRDVLGETTNRDVDKIRDIRINDHLGTDIEGDKIVLIDINGNDNIKRSLVRSGMLMEIAEVAEELAKYDEVSEVTVSSYFPLTNNYGETSDQVVLKVGLEKETLERINWENFNQDNFENVADDYFEHPAMSN